PQVPGKPVLVHAIASSIVPIANIGLQIAGQNVTVDSQGRATYTPQTPGHVAITATATDAEGLVSQYSMVLKVRDPNDQAAPVVSLDPRLTHAPLTTLTNIIGTVFDTNLDYWTLAQAPLGSSNFTTIAGGTNTVSVGTLASI